MPENNSQWSQLEEYEYRKNNLLRELRADLDAALPFRQAKSFSMK
jgi:hypothetical protein